jgi:GNAT superfamily N-acetyltransferase
MDQTDEDLRRFKSCFDENGSPRTEEHLRWQYWDNPAGPVTVDFAHPVADEERLAAIYSVQPTRLRVRGNVRYAVQSLDTLTHKEFRGRGLFVTMAKRTFERAREVEAACVYGFPNGHSAHGFFERLGWQRLDPVPFLVKPLRARYLLGKALRGRVKESLIPDFSLSFRGQPEVEAGVILKVVDQIDERFSHLWSTFARDVGVAVERDAKYLTWRLGKPGQSYRVVGAFEGEHLVGYAISTVKPKHGGRIAYVLELLFDPLRPAVGRALLGELVQYATAENADAILAWNFRHSPNHGAFSRSGFLPLPERLRPIQLHFGVLPLSELPDGALTRRADWYLSYLDSDTV